MSPEQRIAEYYGHGKEVKSGDGNYLTFCPCHTNDKTPSLSVSGDGKGSVIFNCFGNHCDFRDIKDRCRADGLLPEWKPDNDKKYTTTPQPKEERAPRKKTSKELFLEKLPNIIWNNDQPDKSEEYIRTYFKTRSIVFDGDLPKCFKFNFYNNKKNGEVEDDILAAVSKPDDKKVHTIHRLAIDTHDGCEKVTKWRLLGETMGRGVWFDRKREDIELLVGEGIETTLSAMQATGKPGVSAVSANGMRAIILRESTMTIYILVDSDTVKAKNSHEGQKAAVELAKRFEKEREGGTAYLVSPDDTCFSDNPTYLDFNDLLQADPSGESIRDRMSKAVSFKDLEWSPPSVNDETNGKGGGENNHDAEQAMFDRFIFLASENKIIDTIGHDIKESMMVERAFIVSQAGEQYYYQDADGKDKSMPLTKHWLTSDQKKVACATRYKPGEADLFQNGDGRHYYNSFRVPYHGRELMKEQEIQDRLNTWGILMDAVFHKHRPYIEDWLAFSLQQPGKRAGIMPVCISRVGLGKSLLLAIISLVVGHPNFSNGKILEVTGLGKTGTQWGDWIYNKKISCIEEISPEGETNIQYKVLDAMKDIITNETLSLNLKHGRNGTFPVFSNIIGFSNHPDCIKIPIGDRRLFVIDSMGQSLLPQKQYDDIFNWKDDEKNIIALYQSLMSHKISSEFVPGQARMTDAKKMLQADGRTTMQAAFDMVRENAACDLMTPKEISNAVNCAMIIIDDEYQPAESLNASKQFKAILKSTTALVADGKRIRIQREFGKPTQAYIRAIRNGSEWRNASTQEIKEAMRFTLQDDWLSRALEDPLMF